MLIYDKIKLLCKERGITITGTEKELGFARGSLSKIDKNKPSSERINKLAEYFGVQVDYLTGKTEFKTKEEMFRHFDQQAAPDLQEQVANLGTVIDITDEIYTPIKVLGYVAAGIPIEAQEDVIGFEYVPERWTKSGKYFGLQIKGDSMSPRISEGDTVIVRQQNDAESGDIVIVRINSETATCKRLMKYSDRISLHSFNPAYEPKDFTNDQIAELPVEIIGKVVENRQKY